MRASLAERKAGAEARKPELKRRVKQILEAQEAAENAPQNSSDSILSEINSPRESTSQEDEGGV